MNKEIVMTVPHHQSPFAYPIVVDPGMQWHCGIITCSMYFSRSVTKQMVYPGNVAAARADRDTLEPALRQMCRRAFRDSRFPPSFVIDYLVVSTPSLFGEAGFSDDEVDDFMPTLDRVVGEEWAARRDGWTGR